MGQKELRAIFRDKRVDSGIQAVEDSRVGLDQRAQGGAIDAAVGVNGRGEKCANGKRGGLAGLVKPVNGGVSVPDRKAFVGKHLCRGRFAHADGAGEAEDERHAERTALRVASSTSGLVPNQRSKPGAA